MKWNEIESVDDLREKCPYEFDYTDLELTKDWLKLKKTTSYKKGSQFKPGLKWCQQYYPNFFDIQNDRGMSFQDCWNDDVIMQRVLDWGRKGMSQCWTSWVRRAVYLVGGLPNSSMYRPHFARQIIQDHFDDGFSGVLFDPCAGWGGRMLGTISTGWEYVACEPNPETFKNTHILLGDLPRDLSDKPKVTLHNIPAEEFSYDLKVDVVLTSPPYFNLEVYTDDGEQSYNKHNTYEAWCNDWFLPLIEKSVGMLKLGGVSAWNVMNTSKFDMVTPLFEKHKQLGFTLVETYGFDSPLAYMRKLKNKDVTYVFKKEG